jgi:hypothetical protein
MGCSISLMLLLKANKFRFRCHVNTRDSNRYKHIWKLYVLIENVHVEKNLTLLRINCKERGDQNYIYEL